MLERIVWIKISVGGQTDITIHAECLKAGTPLQKKN